MNFTKTLIEFKEYLLRNVPIAFTKQAFLEP